ncbi:hybrid sensor histidine kinase/response regulator [Bacteroidia bacterium]|nr:hybrid sensor histidine kinase/response regulator [Bacteroidia bacterium]
MYGNTYKFYSDNLSNSHVNRTYQDKQGLIWICTDNGLTVFNGFSFKTYYNNPKDSTTLMVNSVLSVLEDSNGYFWVGTTAGLQRFDKETEKFITIPLSYPQVNDFSYINCIIEDHKGNIWLSTNRAGAVCIKVKTHQPVYYMLTNSTICSNKINVIYEDRFNNIWFGSYDNGISILNTQNLMISNYAHRPNDENSLSSNKIFSIIENYDGNILIGTIDKGIDMYEYRSQSITREYIPSIENIYTLYNDSKKNLWIGTDGSGLKRYDYKTKSITTHESVSNQVDLQSAKVHGIIEDTQGNIWLALYQKGVLMLPAENQLFKNIGYNPFNPQKNIGTECVLSISEDHAGDIWVGMDGDGIYRFNAERQIKQHYQTNRLKGRSVLTIFEDSKKRLWAGTYLDGLFLYNQGTDAFEKRSLVIENVEVRHINVITEDDQGNLWIGTNENGLCIYNPETQEKEFFQYDLLKSGNQLLNNTVQALLCEKNNRVWIGTSINGLSCFNRSDHTFTDYTVANGKLTNNDINTLAMDKAGNIWVGTNYGLNFIDVKSGKTTFYTEEDGLSNAAVCGIEIDKDNNLWISTGKGLSNYHTTTRQFTNYYVIDGLANNEFRRGAHFQSQSGELFFGGIGGISYFFPFLHKPTHPLLNLKFTNLLIYDEEVKINDGKKPILVKSIDYSNKIVLNYSIKSFTIGFAGIEYNNQENVVYQIKMEGFDNDWKTLPSDNNHLATYTNLPPNKYRFTVKAYLPNTDEYKERSIEIVVTPPVWLTWWAKLIYVLLALALLYFVYQEILKRIKKKQEDLKRINENQVMQSKLQFFTDISHEIRTPLTLILTPIEHLLAVTTDNELKKTYTLISRNGQRILRLINQIMEMRKLDRGQIKLQAEETDVNELLKEIMTSFDYPAAEKNIQFTLNTQENLPKVWIDCEKLDKVIFNVLSNAFKYTPNNGTIQINVDTTATDLVITISDSGQGIPKEQREIIFNRFYQIHDAGNKSKMGTGIGLHLSRSLMDIHQGNIYVQDSEVGATFVITLPLDDLYLKPEERLKEHAERNVATLVQASITEPVIDNSDLNGIRTAKRKRTLLIVEDDLEIRNYIAGILGDEYNILQTENGKVALELAIKELPDCVISDLSIDEMDGLELCKKLKSNENTCHIPIIMLTARTAVEERVEGLQMGADSYIPKPFNIAHLRVRIQKLIELRMMMKNKFEGKFEIDRENVKIKTSDEKFLERLEKCVKEKMDDPDISVETISKDIGMSRSQLQRKLKGLTNQNPSEYIKTTRLRHAAHLLSTQKLSISEVTYATGFSSLSHFSNSFRDFYGMSPSQWIEVNNPN